MERVGFVERLIDAIEQFLMMVLEVWVRIDFGKFHFHRKRNILTNLEPNKRKSCLYCQIPIARSLFSNIAERHRSEYFH